VDQPDIIRNAAQSFLLPLAALMRRAAVAGLGLVLLATPGMVLAQSNPVSPPSRDELVPLPAQVEQDRTPTLTIDNQMPRAACALDNPDLADIRVALSQVSFVGAEAASDVDLAPAYAAYLGRELPISVLCDIRAQATALLANAGYLAAVEIPEQRIEGGAAEFRVVLGRLTALRVRGDAGSNEKLIARYLQPLVNQPVFNTNQAERQLLLAGDIPGLDVRLSLRPLANGAPGELLGEVAVLRRDMAVDLNIQNYGARALGRFGGLLRAEFYGITGMGDRTSLAFYTSHDFDEQQTLLASHEFMVGSDGLTLGGDLTLGWTNPTLNLPGFDIESDTLLASLHARYPLKRTQAQSIYLSSGYDHVNQTVEANSTRLTRDHVRSAWVRIDLVQTDLDSVARRNGFTPFEPHMRAAASLELRQGLDIFDASQDCRGTLFVGCFADNEIPTRIEQDPTPFLIRGELHTEYRPVPLVTVAIDIRGQFTRDPLPAFEEITGGNYSIGRGYDPASVAGDSGLTSSIELRYGSLAPSDVDGFALQPYVFVDQATVWDRDPSQRAQNPDGLYSIGAGLRFAHGRGVQGDLVIAVPLERTDFQNVIGQKRNDARILFSLTSRLAPWRF
jgi:hemolysin activation/secretion protein